MEEATLSEKRSSTHAFWALLEKDLEEKNDELKSYEEQQYVYAKYDGQFSQVVYFNVRTETLSLLVPKVYLEKTHVMDDKDRASPLFNETRYIISSLLLPILENESLEVMRKHTPKNRKFPFKLVSSSKKNSVFQIHSLIVKQVEIFLTKHESK